MLEYAQTRKNSGHEIAEGQVAAMRDSSWDRSGPMGSTIPADRVRSPELDLGSLPVPRSSAYDRDA
jgi:hypothetical protein